MKIIDSFKNEYAFLSNFYPCRLDYDGLSFTSVESAFQATKTTDIETRRRFVDLTPSEAKRLGRQVVLRQDWEYVKLSVMEDLLRKKFSDKNLELKQKLIATNDAKLIESNWWNDRFWGLCRGKGENNLGKLLMKIRKELMDEI